jgi:hypothetical protein
LMPSTVSSPCRILGTFIIFWESMSTALHMAYFCRNSSMPLRSSSEPNC